MSNNSQEENNQGKAGRLNRRGFLKTGAVLGAAMLVEPVLNKVQAGQNILDQQATSSKSTNLEQPIITQKRIVA